MASNGNSFVSYLAAQWIVHELDELEQWNYLVQFLWVGDSAAARSVVRLWISPPVGVKMLAVAPVTWRLDDGYRTCFHEGLNPEPANQAGCWQDPSVSHHMDLPLRAVEMMYYRESDATEHRCPRAF